jgi:hypothetical protein
MVGYASLTHPTIAIAVSGLKSIIAATLSSDSSFCWAAGFYEVNSVLKPDDGFIIIITP